MPKLFMQPLKRLRFERHVGGEDRHRRTTGITLPNSRTRRDREFHESNLNGIRRVAAEKQLVPQIDFFDQFDCFVVRKLPVFGDDELCVLRKSRYWLGPKAFSNKKDSLFNVAYLEFVTTNVRCRRNGLPSLRQ